MTESSRKTELEKQIDAYVKGELTESEVQDLWTELLKDPEYINHLETEIDVARYYQQQANKSSNYNQYWQWFAAAAAVILIVVGLNIFSNNSLNNYTVENILLRDNLATAQVMRSGDASFEIVDSLLNLGFENAVNNNLEKALDIYHKVIKKYPNTAYAAKAHLNIGILTYNMEQYQTSISNFKKVLSLIDKNDFIREQAYWYMGNAFINIEKFENAKKALQNAYQLSGEHKQEAKHLLDKLSKKIGQ